MRLSPVVAAVLALGAGCASDRMPTSSDLASYGQATADLSAAAASYRAGTSTMQSQSDCLTALQQYMGRATLDVNHVRLVAGRMDDQLAAFGRGMDGDLVCGMGVMDAELARHAAAACASPDMSTDRAEAVQHCDTMQSFVDHLRMRSAELTEMMGSNAGMMNGGMGWSGVDGGWMMSDGGWMGWGHDMPGCSYVDGGYSMMDGGMPWLDGGSMPGRDGGMPGWDGGMPGMDGGHMMDGGMH